MITLKSILFVVIVSVLFFGRVTAQIGKPDWNSLMLQPGADYYKIRDSAFKYFDEHPQIPDSTEGNANTIQNFMRWDYFWRNRVDSAGLEKKGRFTNAQRAMYQHINNLPGTCNSGNVTANWTSLGPSSLSTQELGRVETMCFDPSDATNNTLYIGTRASGIWKTSGSTNGAQSASPIWTALQDVSGYPGMGVQSIVVDPGSSGQTIYVATGALRDYGIGVLKSIDGGTTWNTTGLSFNPNQYISVYKLLMDPGNSSILWALATDKVYRTTDGGITWTAVFAYTRQYDIYNNASRLIDMEFEPGNSATVYVSSDGFSDLCVNGSGAQIFKIFNNGANWANITPPNIKNPLSQNTNEYRWISIATTAADPNNLSILLGYEFNASGSAVASSYVCKYDLSNVLWQTATLTSGANGVGHVVSPTEANVMYSQYLWVTKSINGGVNWSGVSSYNGPTEHADVRFLYIQQGSTSGSNGANDKVWMCNDGGVSYTNTGSAPWSDKNGTGLDITEFYGIAGTEANSALFIGGTQDNSTFRYSNGTWLQNGCGDGADCLIDYTNSNHMYGMCNYFLMESTTGGSSWNLYSMPNSPPWRLGMPIKIDPVDPNTIYLGKEEIYKRTGTTWSSALTNFGGPFIGALAVAPSNNNIMYAAKCGPSWGLNPTGYIWKTTDLQNTSPTWTDLTANITSSLLGNNPFSYTPITEIIVHPTDPNTLWATFGAFWVYKVIKSTDGGNTWSDFSNGLPDFPVNEIIYEKGTNDGLYAGTDVGVYYRDNSMSEWKCFTDNMPTCIVTDLEINYAANIIRASTFGRGVWESHLACPTDLDLTETGAYSSNEFKEAENDITSDAIVFGNLNVTYRAGNEIHLNPGFMVQNTFASSNYFHGFIHACNQPGNSFMRYNPNNTLAGVNSSVTDNAIANDVKLRQKKENTETEIKVFPNPNNGTFTIHILNSFNPENGVEICDLMGRVVFSKGLIKQQEVLDLNLENGTYLIKYYDAIKAQSQAIIINK